MQLVQILLPLYDNSGQHFGEELYTQMRRELTERFGGLTAFTSAPAQGLWTSEGKTHRDDIVVFEVMADELDTQWWSHYRQKLERMFRQDTIVIRAQAVKIL
ncbi:MAG: hypothetical protein ACJ8FU_12585 [Xanthobacteraceae bacterium]|jgi:hypothetical protein|nr:hypothetical protein [Xanthobacteraceae bacterium]